MGNPLSHQGSYSKAYGITFYMHGKGVFLRQYLQQFLVKLWGKKNKVNQKVLQNSRYTLKASIHGSYSAQTLLNSSQKDLFHSKWLSG